MYWEKKKVGNKLVEYNDAGQFKNQGNVNFVIIKNLQAIPDYDEYVQEALKLGEKFDEYRNSNINILFILNIIDKNGTESNSMENNRNNYPESKKINLKNSNLNILFLKNIINIRGEIKWMKK